MYENDARDLRGFHEDHGATFRDVGSRPVVAHYGRPDRAHKAVRNGVGIAERPADIVVVSGDDRVEYVDNVISNAMPAEEARGTYALLLEPNGRIRVDLYAFRAPDRLLLFFPPGTAADIVEEWRERIFIQDVAIELATEDYTVFTVTGPHATEKLATVIDAGIPGERFAFVQGTMGDAGVTIIPSDGLTGEESYEIVCATYDAEVVMDSLLNRGIAAVPFGYDTWETLTIEAGSPLFSSELAGALPNETGVRSALDFEKGCYVGQEVVSRIENRGQPNRRLVGLTSDEPFERGVSIDIDGESVGEVTRAALSPSLDEHIGMGFAPYDTETGSVRLDGSIEGSIVALPFLEGSMTSHRLPRYAE